MSFFYLAIIQSLLFSLVHSQSCTEETGVKLTFYGFPDGMSDTTSFGCSGTTPLDSSSSGTAGGDGSYANPETFATALTNTNFKQCEIVYIPYFQKYFQYMDHCEAAIADYAAGLTHMDLWIGPQSDQGQLPCEQAFGVLTDQTVIRSPPSTLPVTSGALVEGGTCYNEASSGRVFPNYDASSLCSGGSGSGSQSPASTAPAAVATSSTPSIVPSVPATNPNPVSNPPSTYQQKEELVKPAIASSSTLPVVQIEDKVAQPQQPAPTTMLTMTSSSTAAAAPATSTAAVSSSSGSGSGSGKVSGPKMNWNSGMSYSEQISAEMANCASWSACLGDSCSTYNDCAGEWICITGKCHDNKTD